MAAKFWYYPEPDGSHLVEIDLNEPLAELFSDQQVDASDGTAMDGSLSRSVTKNGEIITIQRDRMAGGEELAHQFAAMQSHLDRGYSVAFTADHRYAWAGPVTTNPTGGDFDLFVGPNPFRQFTNGGGVTPIPVANQYIVIENQPPGMITETQKIQAATVTTNGGGTITCSKRVNFTYPSVAFARWYRFWPVLKRPQEDLNRNIITNEHGITFSLSLRLVPDYSTLFSFHPRTALATDPALIGISPGSGSVNDTEGRYSIDFHAELQQTLQESEMNQRLSEIWSRIS